MSVRSLCTGVVAAVTLTLVWCAPALAAPEPFRFLPGIEGFDGSLPAGPPLISPGVFSFPFFDAEDSGPPATRAGSHPYALTVGFASDNTYREQLEKEGRPALTLYPIGITAKYYEEHFDGSDFRYGLPTSDLRDLTVNLPRGVIVDPDAVSTMCTASQLEVSTESEEWKGHGCPATSVVGVATAYVELLAPTLSEVRVPVFRMVPPHGVPAMFGFNVGRHGLIVILTGRVRTGGDYGLSAEAREITAKAAGARHVRHPLGRPHRPRPRR